MNFLKVNKETYMKLLYFIIRFFLFRVGSEYNIVDVQSIHHDLIRIVLYKRKAFKGNHQLQNEKL